jgi:cell division protein FtsB
LRTVIRYPAEVTIFNKRNALVGFITLKALERRRRRKQRHVLRLAAFIALGIVSAGILAALAAVVLRRQRETPGEEGQRLEGFAIADEAKSVDEFDAALPEPGFAA